MYATYLLGRINARREAEEKKSIRQEKAKKKQEEKASTQRDVDHKNQENDKKVFNASFLCDFFRCCYFGCNSLKEKTKVSYSCIEIQIVKT